VHRGLLGSLLELICTRSRDQQILMSTHSGSVLDVVQTESAIAVSLDVRRRTVMRVLKQQTSQKEFAALREYLGKVGSLGAMITLGVNAEDNSDVAVVGILCAPDRAAPTWDSQGRGPRRWGSAQESIALGVRVASKRLHPADVGV
jgi:hypothetical protein